MKRAYANAVILFTGLLIAALINLIVFLLPLARDGSFWLGYGFSMGALVLFVLAGVTELLQPGLRSKFYGLPPFTVVLIYVLAQLVLGGAEMVFSFLSPLLSLLLNLMLLLLMLLGLVTAGAAVGVAAHIDRKTGDKRAFLQALEAELAAMAGKASDPELAAMYKALGEDVRFSDPMSGPGLAALEREIADTVSALKLSQSSLSSAKAIGAELKQLLAERSQTVKAAK